MTQRRLPATGVAATREAKPVPSALMITPMEMKLAVDDSCSLHVAFEELQCHLRQSRDEIARLSRLRAKLTAEVDAKNVSIGYLQQELEKRNRETEELRAKVDEASQDNAELRKRLAGSAGENAGGPSACPGDSKGFLYPVELGSGSSDRENSPAWTLENMSQHLMAQMQREMTELKELGRKLSHSDGTEAPAVTGGGGNDEDGSSEEAALRLVSAMGAQLGAAKDRLLGQRAALLALLSSCRDDRSRRQSPGDGKSRSALSGPRPSDESFRVYFTQQLSGTGAGEPGDSPVAEERLERVCPICEVLFPERVTQDDFEGHVLEHLSGHATVFEDQLSPTTD